MPTFYAFVCSTPKSTSQCGLFSQKALFSLFLRFYGNSSLSVCMLVVWLVGRGRGLPPCRVVALKKASVSICLFLQLMVADELGWKRSKTPRNLLHQRGPERIWHERSAIYIRLEASQRPTFTRLKSHSANEPSAILSLVRPIHVSGRTCRSPPGRDAVEGGEPSPTAPELTVISLRLFGQFSLVHEVLSVCHGA